MDLKIIAEAVVVGWWELKNSNVLSNIDEIWNAYWKTLAKIGCCFWPRTSLWLVNVSDPQHALRRNLIFGPDSNNAAKSVSQITNSFSTVVPQHFIFPFKVTSEQESDTPGEWHTDKYLINTQCSTFIHKKKKCFVGCFFGNSGLHFIIRKTSPAVLSTATRWVGTFSIIFYFNLGNSASFSVVQETHKSWIAREQ